jgi:hypothetical protein
MIWNYDHFLRWNDKFAHFWKYICIQQVIIFFDKLKQFQTCLIRSCKKKKLIQKNISMNCQKESKKTCNSSI